jgi:hypothetical protein
MSVWIARVAGFGAFAQEHSFVTGAKPYVNAAAGVVSDREEEREQPSFQWCSGPKNSKRIVLQQLKTGLHSGYHLDPIQGPAGCMLREFSPLPGVAAHLISVNILQDLV